MWRFPFDSVDLHPQTFLKKQNLSRQRPVLAWPGPQGDIFFGLIAPGPEVAPVIEDH